jgi:outer membrane protein assembly complex protein YaeT
MEPVTPASRTRRVLRSLATIGGGSCLLAASLALGLQSGPARRFALDRVIAFLASRQIELQTDALHYNVFSLSIDLRNVRVRSTRLAHRPIVATIGRAHLDLSLLQLLRGHYVLQSGVLHDVEIECVVEPDGQDTVGQQPARLDEPVPVPDYLIASLSIRRARVRFTDYVHRIDLVLSFPSVDVAGNPRTGRHRLRLEKGSGRAHAGGRAAAIDRISGALDVGRDDLSIERLRIEAGGSQAAIGGVVRTLAAPQLALTLQATIDAARAARAMSVRNPIAGTLALDATVHGAWPSPDIHAQLSAADLRIRSLDAARVDIRASYDGRAERAVVSSALLEASWGQLKARGQVAFGSEDRSRAHVEISRVDVSALMRGLRVPYAVDTRIDGYLDARWPGLDYREASARGRATLTPRAASGAWRAFPVGGRVSARRSGRTTVAELHAIETAGAHLTGRVQIDGRDRLEGQLQANLPDLARTLRAVRPPAGTSSSGAPPWAVAGTGRVDVRLAGTIDDPIAHAIVVVPSFSVRGADGIALAAQMTLTPAVLTVGSADVNWKGMHAAVAGTVGLLRDRPLDLTLHTDPVNLQVLFPATDGAGVPISGTLRADGTLHGTVADPLGRLTLRGGDLTAFGERLGSLTAGVALTGREVVLSEFVVDKPQPGGAGLISAMARYDLDRQRYAFDLRSQNVRVVSLRLPGGQDVRGSLQLAAAGTGRVSSPSGTATLAIDALELHRVPADDVDASIPPAMQLGRVVIAASAQNQQATIDASLERFNLGAHAMIRLSRPWPAELTVHAGDLELERLPFAQDAPLAGRLRATVNATGDLADPAHGRATAHVETFEGSWNGQPFSVASAGELRYANQRLDIGRLQLTARDSSLTVTGELPLAPRAGAGDLAVEARANLATISQYLPESTKMSADGLAALAGSLRGTLDSITPDLVLTVENGVLWSPGLGPGVSNVQLRARVADGAAEIERLTANWGTASIDASATLPLDVLPGLPVGFRRTGQHARIKASIRGFDPGVVPGAPAGLTGRADLDVEATAARTDLAALEGQIDCPQLELAFGRLALSQKEPSRVRIASGTAMVEKLELAGSAGAVAASGTAGLTGERPLDLKIDGTFNVAALSALTQRIRTDGRATWKVSAHGSMTAPALDGTLDLADASVAIDDLNIAAANVRAHADLAGSQLRLTELAGEINGGVVDGAGSVTIGGGSISDVDLQVSARDVAYDAPLDLRSLSDATIRLSRRGEQLLVAGQVTVREAGLTADVNFDEGLFATIGGPRTLDLARARSAFLDRVRFDVGIRTAAPVLVYNNLARAEIDSDLRLVGSPHEPGLTGRLTIGPGGQLTLNARRYEVERGIVTFVDERRILPSIDLVLNTKASNYDVRIAVAGTPRHTETNWTSEPPLPEPDIMALVLTGRTVDQMRGEESEVARVQALSYLTGRVGSRFGRGLERATGISEVRIEPVLIANETDPTARLTVGQNVTEQVKLVYSTNLTDSNDQIWVAEYDVTRRFEMRGVRERDDDSYRLDFRHDLRFGGDPAPRRQLRQRPRVARLTVSADGETDEATLRRAFRLKEGDAYEFFAARNGLERVERLYLERGYLQSRVRLEHEIHDGTAALMLRVASGPIVDLRFEGITPPSKIQQQVRTAWQQGVFDKQRCNDGAAALQVWLIRDKYLQPRLHCEIKDLGGRRVVFRTEAGPRYESIALAFEGTSALEPDDLDRLVRQQRLEVQLFTDPLAVTDVLQRYYHEQGYLSAEVEPPRYEFHGSRARVIVPVREGRRYQVRRMTVAGNAAFASDEIVRALPLAAGSPFGSAAAERSLDRIRELYWPRGYNDMRSEYGLVIDRSVAAVDVSFTIEEGRQHVLAGIAVGGNRKISDRLIRGEIELLPSQPLDLGLLARSRRNLYGTGAFSIADITREDSTAASTPAAATRDDGPADDERRIRLDVSVREVQPVQLRYGLSYDTEGGLGGILDFSLHNTLGKARVFGVQGRYDSEIHEARIYVSQPSLRTWPRKTTASVYFREDLNPPTDKTDPFDISRRGAAIQQQAHFGKVYTWSYGYRHELATTLEPSLGVGATETVRVTPLSSTLTRETRDEVLDASTGTFLSQAFAYSPPWLGSDRPYWKYYGQYFHYFPLSVPKPGAFTNEVLRTRLVFATAVRIGFARGIGGDVPTSERFYAGGSTTLRGFEQNAVGPVTNDVPAGGNAVLVLNNELRFPVLRSVDGVLFLDVGNVYATISDFSFADVRESGGAGVRLRTRWVLLRSDYGFVLDPRSGERRSRFYFSIGQAF